MFSVTNSINHKLGKFEHESYTKPILPKHNACIRHARLPALAAKPAGEDDRLCISVFAFQEILFPTEARVVFLEFLLRVPCAIGTQ